MCRFLEYFDDSDEYEIEKHSDIWTDILTEKYSYNLTNNGVEGETEKYPDV